MAIRDDLPATYVQEAMALDARGVVELFKIEMFPPSPNTPVTLYLNNKVDIHWQGSVWEGFPCNLAGEMANSTGEVGRPKFSVANPSGIFSTYVHQRWLDNAIVTRYRVLTIDIKNDVNSFVRNTWKVSKIIGLNKSTATMELRGVLDGQYFTLPGRRFQPPEFPHVSLT